MDWWIKLIELLSKKWIVVQSEPLLFVMLFAISGFCGFVLVKWIYCERLEHRRSEIELLKTRLEGENEKITKLTGDCNAYKDRVSSLETEKRSAEDKAKQLESNLVIMAKQVREEPKSQGQLPLTLPPVTVQPRSEYTHRDLNTDPGDLILKLLARYPRDSFSLSEIQIHFDSIPFLKLYNTLQHLQSDGIVAYDTDSGEARYRLNTALNKL